MFSFSLLRLFKCLRGIALSAPLLGHLLNNLRGVGVVGRGLRDLDIGRGGNHHLMDSALRPHCHIGSSQDSLVSGEGVHDLSGTKPFRGLHEYLRHVLHLGNLYEGSGRGRLVLSEP